jgi:hypothetical protein
MYIIAAGTAGAKKYLDKLIPYLSDEIYQIDLSLEKDVVNTLENLNAQNEINIIITGTSYEGSPENRLIVWAKNNGIPCVGIIDHWSWYRKRFEVNLNLILPDYIFVNDNIAYEEAIMDGLPSNKLLSVGNPVFENLLLQKEKNVVDKMVLCESHQLPTQKNIIIFFSEELRSCFTQDSEDYLGYDEYEVLQDIINNLTINDHLAIKLHPEESRDKYDELLKENVSIIDHISVFELAHIANIVIGMASIILLELAIYRSDVISYRPNARKKFIGETLGATIHVSNFCMIEKTKQLNSSESFAKRFVGSGYNISQILEDIKIGGSLSM